MILIDYFSWIHFFKTGIFTAMSPMNLMKLVATDTQTLLIMESTILRWASQLPFSPMVMKRGRFMVSRVFREPSEGQIQTERVYLESVVFEVHRVY